MNIEIITKDGTPTVILPPTCTIRIAKEYGPLAANDVQVTLDISTAEWVIERLCFNKGPIEFQDYGSYWIEVARFDCQDHEEDDGNETK